ncbi:MAG: hypothetical protein UT54_C0061G0003 [Candidatus Daviesbacteria bacterium GW2011_GWB1_39_5]|uniref:SIR2-like domain-containing protein n=1 Tax=Candidatus Daviesbacteria bacterium GW2011_GWC2_40_12 TaxID=1618431 RepID=A0A0G0T5E4_9BACT|nr:MAG: hypothetical protein UT04_C0001G0034 [Candidatus Daviesbacteria bacterium GW2011_GWF2_38_7]KKR16869.1 MAG: hypothetical protein UT45_C0004G0200 [Candidatus Daviesbacteria bacterium GW2011_GWA2_39_33]KKR22827.1 MAG: hypothetical protein UT54_C0061G0003 [Candidatus Daviesbacteria bacterium GW2011_GWB1_39_5]KKR42350.1 MAG: hypothetical protein UT77_C0002G0003 [Candidatus Daviesbacteria bacterium GW2011_GWC2_40_12]OGE42222.1 MAG: hypothetical protein A3A53_00015 [Candidatus Daviesbacteria b
MAYPLIILGAGASMDYLRADDHIEHRNNNFSRYRSPLMNQLFDDTRFYEILDRHPMMGSFATDVMNAMGRSNPNFEAYLTDARDNLAKTNPAIYSQLVSLIFYLADLFSEISVKYYYPRNHYIDLFQKIDNYCGSQSCIVNFNYDLLLERSLCAHLNGGFDILKVDDYINKNVKVIKIHGACNWRYNPQTVHTKQTTAFDFFSNFSKELITNGTKDQIYPLASDINNVNFNPEYVEGLQSWTVKLPAISLPLKDKTSNYVCNESHINILKESIKKADRVLIIGWRGADQYLFTLLKNELGDKKINVTVVAKNSTAESVIQHFASNVPQFRINPKNVHQTGFSDFMKTEDYENFFKNYD